MTERKNFDVSLNEMRSFEDAVGSLPIRQRTLIEKREKIVKDKRYKKHAIFVDYRRGHIDVLPYEQDYDSHWVTVYNYDKQ